jgi:hypothetical protein
MQIGTYSLCNFSTVALLLVSMQNATQVSVKERTRGTLFFTATRTSASSKESFFLIEALIQAEKSWDLKGILYTILP